MKVILSRKGFDSTAGGKPSPILPDDTLLSLPIPETNSIRKYSDLRYGGNTYEDIITQLGGKCGGGSCHLDPDIRQDIYDAPAGWKPAFGQHGIPQKTLHNAGVGQGDLFLFFGWFRWTEHGADGKLRYKRGAGDGVHTIFGYLQIGDIVTGKEIEKYRWHPHAHMQTDDNCLYISSDKLSWDSTKQGYGVFQYEKRLVLTKDGMSKSCWNLPDFFKGLKITGLRSDSWQPDSQGGKYCRIADKQGQEFVIEESPDVEKWAKSLING